MADGRGRPVLLIPGFLAGDGSLSMMAGWLKRTGYRPSRAGIVSNVNCAGVLLPRLEERLERLVELQGKRAAVVGQSRGGTLAKVLARRRPDLVVRRGRARLAAGGAAGGAPAGAAPGRGREPPGLARRAGALQALVPQGRLLLVVLGRPGGAARRRRSRSCRSTRGATASSTGAPASTRTRPSWSRSAPRHCGMAVSRAAWRAVAEALESFRGRRQHGAARSGGRRGTGSRARPSARRARRSRPSRMSPRACRRFGGAPRRSARTCRARRAARSGRASPTCSARPPPAARGPCTAA